MKYIYGDIRDLWLRRIKNYCDLSAFVIDHPKYSSRNFILYNSLGSFFCSKNTTIIYLKISHIIKNQDACVYEFYNLKKFESVCLKLNNTKCSEQEELHIKFITSDYKLYSKNLSKTYQKSRGLKKRDYDHFYFKYGKAKRISIYPAISIYKLIFYVIVLFLFLLLGYIKIC